MNLENLIDSPSVHINELPTTSLSFIFSFLSLPDIARAMRVCSEWRREITSGLGIERIDVGTYFAGVIPPHPYV